MQQLVVFLVHALQHMGLLLHDDACQEVAHHVLPAPCCRTCATGLWLGTLLGLFHTAELLVMCGAVSSLQRLLLAECGNVYQGIGIGRSLQVLG